METRDTELRELLVAAGNGALGAAVLWKNVLLTRQLPSPSCCEPPPSVSRFLFFFCLCSRGVFLCFQTQTHRQHIHSLTHPSRSETHQLTQAHTRGLSGTKLEREREDRFSLILMQPPLSLLHFFFHCIALGIFFFFFRPLPLRVSAVTLIPLPSSPSCSYPSALEQHHHHHRRRFTSSQCCTMTVVTIAIIINIIIVVDGIVRARAVVVFYPFL